MSDRPQHLEDPTRQALRGASDLGQVQINGLMTSEQIDKITAALVEVQGKVGNVAKDASNPHFNSSYVTLAAIREACRQPLVDAGIAVVQAPDSAHNVVSVTTTLLHTSGQYISSRCSAQVRDAGAQQVGSGITYLRRYALAAMVGIAPEEDDDDGNGASGNGGQWGGRGNERPAGRQQPQQQRQGGGRSDQQTGSSDLEAALADIHAARGNEAKLDALAIEIKKCKWSAQDLRVIGGAFTAARGEGRASSSAGACAECGGKNGRHKASCAESDGKAGGA